MKLFQKICIVNAIKFRKEDTLSEIRISGEKADRYWQLAVNDNGSDGSQHSEKIFIIFQRLIPRNEYPGSGIGLITFAKIANCIKAKSGLNLSLKEEYIFFMFSGDIE